MPEVVVIGAGPYGLSAAACLRGHGVETQVFGEPMVMWEKHMPRGMVLKSDGFASNLTASEPYTLEMHCREVGHPYADLEFRTPRDLLIQYAKTFLRKRVGSVDQARIIGLRQRKGGFDLRLDTGEGLFAKRVIVATGLMSYLRLPAWTGNLPPEAVSHSSGLDDLTPFTGRRVIVIGGGQSAFETAALLNEQGAKVTILMRRPAFWFDPAKETVHASLWHRMRHPNFGLGPGWRSFFWSEMPRSFHRLPQKIRLAKAYSTFGPAGSGWLKHRVVGVIPTEVGQVMNAAFKAGEVRLDVVTGAGKTTFAADHVVAATGYRADIRREPFWEGATLDKIEHINGIPVLGQGFESSIPGLHFIGYVSAASFGPSMRFIYGTRFAAPMVTQFIRLRSTASSAAKPELAARAS